MVENPKPPSKGEARFAGFLYLLVVFAGPFLLLYVPGKLFVPGNPAATATNILTHQALFKAYMLVGVVAELLFVAVALALYRLLKGVNAELAGAMVILVLLDAPIAFLRIANEVATLAFLRGPGFLSAFDGPQRNALATLFIEVDRHGVFVSEVFWGLWLLPLGLLVYRSGFMPKFLGVWLFVNGVTYVGLSAIGIAFPERYKFAMNAATPVLLGEVALMLWLLVVGVRVKGVPPAASALHAP